MTDTIWGAIVGDIVGSVYEFDNHLSKDFPLFRSDCFPTDDSIMTLSVAKALIDCDFDWDNLAEATVTEMQSIGRHYPGCGYGGRFIDWMFSNDPKPYNSFGNGAAMRVSPVAYVASDMDEVKELSKIVTGVSHNHPEGIKGAEAAAVATWMALNGFGKKEIIKEMSKYYNMNFTLDEIRPYFDFDESCQGTVPQAIKCFEEADGFEDTIRNAIALGGDCDTTAAIAGGIAGAFYGVPDRIAEDADVYLDSRLSMIRMQFDTYII